MALIINKIENDVFEAHAALNAPAFLTELGKSVAYQTVERATSALEAELAKISEHFVIDHVDLSSSATLVVRWHHASSGRQSSTSTLLIPSW